jgi:hypothetical protein
VSPTQHRLRALYMSGSKDNRSQMKEDIRPFLLSLMVNTALETLDISGHAMGDLGAKSQTRIHITVRERERGKGRERKTYSC